MGETRPQASRSAPGGWTTGSWMHDGRLLELPGHYRSADRAAREQVLEAVPADGALRPHRCAAAADHHGVPARRDHPPAAAARRDDRAADARPVDVPAVRRARRRAHDRRDDGDAERPDGRLGRRAARAGRDRHARAPGRRRAGSAGRDAAARARARASGCPGTCPSSAPPATTPPRPWRPCPARGTSPTSRAAPGRSPASSTTSGCSTAVRCRRASPTSSASRGGSGSSATSRACGCWRRRCASRGCPSPTHWRPPSAKVP